MRLDAGEFSLLMAVSGQRQRQSEGESERWREGVKDGRGS
jgi:hypothetical protein